MNQRHFEAAFETVIEAHLLANGYTPVAPEGFDRDRAIFPETVLTFIRDTQPKEWAKLEAVTLEAVAKGRERAVGVHPLAPWSTSRWRTRQAGGHQDRLGVAAR